MVMPDKKPVVLLGLYGNKGVGKDTIGYILRQEHSFHVFSFAKHLYDCVSKLFHVRVEVLQARETKEANMPALYGRSPREVLKYFGTDFVRDFISHNFWIDEVAKRISDTCRSSRVGIKAVITDVAMLNEIKYVLDNGGYILYIERPGCEEFRVREAEAGIAETYLMTLLMEENSHVLRVQNDSSIEYLAERIATVMTYISINSIPAILPTTEK